MMVARSGFVYRNAMKMTAAVEFAAVAGCVGPMLFVE